MNNNNEIKDKLISLSESVRGEVLFDLNFEIDTFSFFKLKFENDKLEKGKICNSIYKYSINGRR